MSRKRIISAFLAGVSVGIWVAGVMTPAPNRPSAPPAASATLVVNPSSYTNSIMPLGDSITEGVMPGPDDGGYRSRLDAILTLRHVYVGSLTDAQGRKHEGHSGWKLTDLIPAADGWVRPTHPTYVLLHIGTNDAGAGRSSTQMLGDLATLLDAIHAASPRSLVIFAQIPEVPNNPEVENAALRGYNAGMPGLLAARQPWTKLVDQSRSEISTDGIHPSPAGYARMASVWKGVLPA